MECSSKLVEAVALKQATVAVVANFIHDTIIFRFGIPKYIQFNNVTFSVNSHVRELYEEYGIDYIKFN